MKDNLIWIIFYQSCRLLQQKVQKPERIPQRLEMVVELANSVWSVASIYPHAVCSTMKRP